MARVKNAETKALLMASDPAESEISMEWASLRRGRKAPFLTTGATGERGDVDKGEDMSMRRSTKADGDESRVSKVFKAISAEGDDITAKISHVNVCTGPSS